MAVCRGRRVVLEDAVGMRISVHGSIAPSAVVQ